MSPIGHPGVLEKCLGRRQIDRSSSTPRRPFEHKYTEKHIEKYTLHERSVTE